MYSVGTGELISMKFWWNDMEKNRSTQQKLALLPLCQQQIPNGLAWE